ncbi:Werner Syndrome-like exonuclease, partial [Quillaja saponaria]
QKWENMLSIDIQGVRVEAQVVGRSELIDGYLTKLWMQLQQSPVIGIDIKMTWIQLFSFVLCAGTHCLIVQLCHLNRGGGSLYYLGEFLNNKRSCFVGVKIHDKILALNRFSSDLKCETATEVGHLAARVLKKPRLESLGIAELGNEVGINIQAGNSGIQPSSWRAEVFSEEEIKNAI